MSEETSSPATEAGTEGTATETTTEAVVTDNGEATEQTISYANGKYNTVSDLENGYAELQKSYSSKLGGFDGSPEAYELSEGVETSPRIEALQAWGKDNQLNNDALNSIIAMDVEATQAANNAYVAEQKEILGKDADVRLENLKDWAAANGGDEAVFTSMMSSAAAVQFMEGVMKGSQGTTPTAAPSAPAVDADTLRQMRFAKDQYGNRKMSSDPAYRLKVESLEAEMLKS